MKKGYKIMVLLLLAAIAITIVIFIKYLLPMQQLLRSHEKEANDLSAKIEELQEEFDSTVPAVVIEEWQEQKQPWVRALNIRTPFFSPIEDDPIEIPEGVIPKFWYREEFPKLERELFQNAEDKGIRLTNISFDVELPNSYSDQNPSREEITEQINKFNFGKQMTEFIFEAKPMRVDEVVVWPSESYFKGKSGEVTTRTIGYRLIITYENLLKFLRKLNLTETYITVDAIKISKSNLTRPGDPLTVELLVSDARFKTNIASANATNATEGAQVANAPRPGGPPGGMGGPGGPRGPGGPGGPRGPGGPSSLQRMQQQYNQTSGNEENSGNSSAIVGFFKNLFGME